MMATACLGGGVATPVCSPWQRCGQHPVLGAGAERCGQPGCVLGETPLSQATDSFLKPTVGGGFEDIRAYAK